MTHIHKNIRRISKTLGSRRLGAFDLKSLCSLQCPVPTVLSWFFILYPFHSRFDLFWRRSTCHLCVGSKGFAKRWHTHTRIPGTIGQRLTLPRARGLVPKSFSKLFARTQFCLKHNLSLVPSVLRSVFLHMSLKASLLRFWNILDLTWTTPGAGFCGEVHLWALE